MQKGGRKIKRSKSLYGNKRRRKTKSTVTLFIMIFVVGGLVFLGYSVGEPILNFLKNGTGSSLSSEPWSPSDVTDSTSASVTEPSSSSSVSSESVSKDPGTFSAGELNEADIQSAAALTAALNQVKQSGYTAVTVTLKAQGGRILYKSNIELANQASPSTSELSAAQIAELIHQNGLKALARVSTLYDNLAPKANRAAGYYIEGSDSSWFDNSPQKGGKPWLNPFSETTQTYMSDFAAEIGLAGFDQVICSDVVFPPFRPTDLTYVGAAFQDRNRSAALTHIVDIFKNRTEDTATMIGVEVSALGALQGTEEVFKPAQLQDVAAVAMFRNADFSGTFMLNGAETDGSTLSVYDRVRTVYEALHDMVQVQGGNMSVIPLIVTEGMSDNDRSEALRALQELGYSAYILQ